MTNTLGSSAVPFGKVIRSTQQRLENLLRSGEFQSPGRFQQVQDIVRDDLNSREGVKAVGSGWSAESVRGVEAGKNVGHYVSVTAGELSVYLGTFSSDGKFNSGRYGIAFLLESTKEERVSSGCVVATTTDGDKLQGHFGVVGPEFARYTSEADMLEKNGGLKELENLPPPIRDVVLEALSRVPVEAVHTAVDAVEGSKRP